MDCVVKNGTVLTAAGTVVADVGIQGERIAAIGTGLQGDRGIEAAGHYVFPGFIDAHVHLQMVIGDIVTGDDFATGTLLPGNPEKTGRRHIRRFLLYRKMRDILQGPLRLC